MLLQTIADGALALQIGHTFAPEDAERIHEVVERAAPGTAIQIDFRRVRECQDYALALLARDLAAGRARIDVRGMSQHQRVCSGTSACPRTAP